MYEAVQVGDAAWQPDVPVGMATQGRWVFAVEADEV